MALFMLLIPFAFCAQIRSGNQVVYKTPEGYLRLQVCNDRIVRITKSNTDEFVKDEPWMVIRYDFDPVEFTVDSNTLITSALRLDIDGDLITIHDRDGRMLYSETSSTLGNMPGNECIL